MTRVRRDRRINSSAPAPTAPRARAPVDLHRTATGKSTPAATNVDNRRRPGGHSSTGVAPVHQKPQRQQGRRHHPQADRQAVLHEHHRSVAAEAESLEEIMLMISVNKPMQLGAHPHLEQAEGDVEECPQHDPVGQEAESVRRAEVKPPKEIRHAPGHGLIKPARCRRTAPDRSPVRTGPDWRTTPPSERRTSGGGRPGSEPNRRRSRRAKRRNRSR